MSFTSPTKLKRGKSVLHPPSHQFQESYNVNYSDKTDCELQLLNAAHTVPERSIFPAFSGFESGTESSTYPRSQCDSMHEVNAFSPASSFSISEQSLEAQNCFACPHCDYTTNVRRHYESHELIHSMDSKSFPCPDCPYIAKQLSNLKAHLRKHTGERPYVCLECRRGFTQHISLHKHIKTHPSEVSKICSHCGASV